MIKDLKKEHLDLVARFVKAAPEKVYDACGRQANAHGTIILPMKPEFDDVGTKWRLWLWVQCGFSWHEIPFMCEYNSYADAWISKSENDPNDRQAVEKITVNLRHLYTYGPLAKTVEKADYVNVSFSNSGTFGVDHPGVCAFAMATHLGITWQTKEVCAFD